MRGSTEFIARNFVAALVCPDRADAGRLRSCRRWCRRWSRCWTRGRRWVWCWVWRRSRSRRWWRHSVAGQCQNVWRSRRIVRDGNRTAAYANRSRLCCHLNSAVRTCGQRRAARRCLSEVTRRCDIADGKRCSAGVGKGQVLRRTLGLNSHVAKLKRSRRDDRLWTWLRTGSRQRNPMS